MQIIRPAALTRQDPERTDVSVFDVHRAAMSGDIGEDEVTSRSCETNQIDFIPEDEAGDDSAKAGDVSASKDFTIVRKLHAGLHNGTPAISKETLEADQSVYVPQLEGCCNYILQAIDVNVGSIFSI